MRRWKELAGVTTWTLVSALFATSTQAQDSIPQWRRWEKTIVSSRDFTIGGGNPYRDLVLRVQFTKRGTGETFTQDAFWEGLTAAPKSFRARAALSAAGAQSATWDWTVVGCTGTTGGQNCAQSTTWAPASGTITVTANTSSNIRLYDRGFLKQLGLSSTTKPAFMYSWSQLFYGDSLVPFYFAADTAWTAPPREIFGQTTAWSSFVSNRKAKQFTTVLISPAVAWQPGATDLWPALPGAGDFSFNQAGTCTAPLPNDCSKPRPEYWQAFDNLVQQANAQDLYVGIIGVIDPVGLGDGDHPFPNQANAVAFARHLAARMAGNHVFFSPGFDTQLGWVTAGGVSTRDVMSAVGAALKTATPRHLVTNHLAGRSTCTDYQSFASNSPAAWMTLYVFQSGHAKTVAGSPGQICPGRLSSEGPLRAALRRAREVPITLAGFQTPVALPAFNGEGPYDDTSYAPDEVDNRYRLRHANHLSSLSNALGVTYGAERLVFWHQPGNTYFNLPSANDMTTLANRFRNRAGLSSSPGWLLNQRPDPDHENKMALASDGASVVLAYAPGRQTNDDGPALNNIVVGTTGLSGLACGTPWTRKWLRADNGTSFPGGTACTASAGRITIGRPDCNPGQGSNPDCDWVLELQRTGSALASPFVPGGAARVDVWVEGGADGVPAQLRFEIEGPSLASFPRQATVAEEPDTYLDSPRLARVGPDYLVVWESEPQDGSLRGVFAQLMSSGAAKAGSRLQVNSYTEHDQAEPAVASDLGGNAVIVWSSFGQDGDLGGIFARRFNSSLIAQGLELQVNQEAAGHQERPQIVVDSAGHWIVAWTTRQGEDGKAAVSWRKLSAAGLPLIDQQNLVAAEEAVHLVELAADPLGGFRIRWARRGLTGALVEVLEQAFDAAGDKVGSPIARYP